jgi:DNA primase
MSGLDYPAVRALIPIRRILEAIDYRPVTIRGDQWRGPCPLHSAGPGSETCFSIHLGKSVYRCFRCHACGNQLDLWIALTHLPLYEATLDLCRRLRLDPPRLPQIRNSQTAPPRTMPTGPPGSP